MTAVAVASLPNVSEKTKELVYAVMGTSARVIERNYNLLGSGRALNVVTTRFMQRIRDQEAANEAELAALIEPGPEEEGAGGQEPANKRVRVRSAELE